MTFKVAVHDNYEEKTKLSFYHKLHKFLEQKGVKLKKNKKHLEIGGGDFPFIQIFNTPKCTVVDPDFPPRSASIKFKHVQKKIEAFSSNQKYDSAIALNSIDHVADIAQATSKISQSLKPGGYYVVILNCYATKIDRYFFHTFRKFIDKPHSFHFTESEFISYCSKFCFKFKLKTSDIENKLGIESEKPLSLSSKLKHIATDLWLIPRILGIKITVLCTRQKFRPPCLFVFERK